MGGLNELTGPVDRARVHRWVAAYERAWRSPGTDALAALFAEGATYLTAPFEQPHVGLSAIAAMWEAERDGPDEAFTMDWEAVAIEGDTAVVRVEVSYGDPRPIQYLDLWIIRFDGAGRCRVFEEWPFWPRGTEGNIASGPH